MEKGMAAAVGSDMTGPPNDGGDADPSLKGLSFLTIQATIIAVCVTIKLRAVIAGEDYDGIIGESGFLQDIQKLTDSFIHAGDHSVQSRQSGIKAFPERCGIFFRALEGKVRRVIGGMEEKGLLSVLADKTDGFFRYDIGHIVAIQFVLVIITPAAAEPDEGIEAPAAGMVFFSNQA